MSILQSSSRLIVLGGPSGAGKTSAAAALAKKYSNVIHYTRQLTTRSPRTCELSDPVYDYIAFSEFAKLDEEGRLVVQTEFVGNLYGFDSRFAEETAQFLQDGKSVVIDSIHSIKDWIDFSEKQNIEMLSIFLHAPLGLLKDRIRSRQTIDENILKQRLEHAIACLEEKQFYMFDVDTTYFESAGLEIERIAVEVARVNLQNVA